MQIIFYEIIEFEVFPDNSAYCEYNTCHRQSMCQQIVLRFQIRLRNVFSNSIYLEFMWKYGNSGAVLVSAVFGTR